MELEDIPAEWNRVEQEDLIGLVRQKATLTRGLGSPERKEALRPGGLQHLSSPSGQQTGAKF